MFYSFTVVLVQTQVLLILSLFFCRVVGSPRSSFSLDAWHAENEGAAIAMTRECLLLSLPRPRTPARSDNGNNVAGVTNLALHGGSGNQRESSNYENSAFPTIPKTSVSKDEFLIVPRSKQGRKLQRRGTGDTTLTCKLARECVRPRLVVPMGAPAVPRSLLRLPIVLHSLSTPSTVQVTLSSLRLCLAGFFLCTSATRLAIREQKTMEATKSTVTT